ncbi:MAG: hypothetical protein KAS72_12765 [Phycisphaerales bacterium]|nr:hypothetical protein [Phycisphaerales bacterium]
MSKISQARQEQLLVCILGGRMDLEEICASKRLTLQQLADWGSRDRTQQALDALRRLADVRTQLLICRYRAHAAAKLIELTGDEASLETARKACVDLLRVNVAESVATAPPEEQEPIDAEALRAFLSELGRSTDGQNEPAT